MKTREKSQSFFLIGRVLTAAIMILLCLVCLLSYSLLIRGQTVPSYGSRTTSFDLAQVTADVRTVAAAISYLLQPEAITGPPPANPTLQYIPATAQTSDSSTFFAYTKTNRASRS